MHSRSSRLLILVLLLLLGAQAEAFRCGNKLIRTGQTELEVIRLCGKPASVQQLGYIVRPYVYESRSGLTGKQVQVTGLEEQVRVTAYVYDFGPRKLMRRLVFEGGILQRIESLGKGSRNVSD